MSAPELTGKAVEAIRSGRFDLIVLNFANPDMVGHTGVLAAAIRAVETVDAGLGRIAEAVRAAGGALLVTADHGNCELMRDPVTGGPHTAHTTNPVPVLLAGGPRAPRSDGRLADIAPTLLALLGLPQPAAMTGRSLLRDGERGHPPLDLEESPQRTPLSPHAEEARHAPSRSTRASPVRAGGLLRDAAFGCSSG